MNVARVHGLRIAFGDVVVVDDVSFTVSAGERVAIVGESGAGKSLTAAALGGLVPASACVTAQTLEIAGQDLRSATDRDWYRVRGRRVGFVWQDALNSLDPLRRVAREIAEPLDVHGLIAAAERSLRVRELMTAVSIPDPDRRARQYLHELSGGLRQRALIASAISTDPDLLVADEPTTALDATVQQRVLDLLRELTDTRRGLLFVSHDLGAVARIADRVLVMQAGTIVEQGETRQVLTEPKHPYTRELVAASQLLPVRAAPVRAAALNPVGEPVLIARDLSKSYGRTAPTMAVRGVSLSLMAGQTLAIVGESGAGKTTLVRLLLAATRPDTGEVLMDGQLWSRGRERDRRRRRARIQHVSQNPRAAFDPRWSVGRSIGAALGAGGTPRKDRAARVAELLSQVELDRALADRRMSELSGGQRQRAAIARALVTDPAILILDEPLSALDVSIAARIMDLLERLQQAHNLAVVLVTHDLRVVARLADDVIVMRAGVAVESGPVAAVFADPRHPFTRELIDAARGVPR